MKRSQRDEDASPRAYKLLKLVPLPDRVQEVADVMGLVSEFLMSFEEAAQEAAKSGRAPWLETILPRMRINMGNMANQLIEIGAACGHCEVIETVCKWWKKPDVNMDDVKYQPLTKAVAGGHLKVVVLLLKLFQWNIDKAMEKALEDQQQDMVEAICQLGNRRQALLWAAGSNNLPGLEIVFARCGSDDIKIFRRAMIKAAANGHLDVVKFLHNKCGHQVYEEEVAVRGFYACVSYSHDYRDGPLAAALKNGHLEIVEFLYANRGYTKSAMEVVVVVAAEQGRLERVEQFYMDGWVTKEYREIALCHAAGCDRVEIVRFLLSADDYEIDLLDMLLCDAAECGAL